ncbi:hypothetical protein SLS62_000873 [Diatrype stigma]|uniref:Helicase ATP-binding domain-containing protein n=1 Tax=Diatrype stigma TaxID=117547 RepID=A0AAN9YSF9_9PEZI
MNDPLPDALLDFLELLPSGDQPDEVVEPPTKRPRVEAPETVNVARESFTLARPSCPGPLATTRERPILRQHVGRYLKLHYDEAARLLILSSKVKSPYGAFRSELYLGDPQFTKSVLVALNVATHSRDSENDDGGLWASVDMDFERKGDTDYLRFLLTLKWNTSTYTLRDKSQRALSQQVLDAFLNRSVPNQDGNSEKLLPQAFYEAAFMPDSTYPGLSSLTVPGLATKLYPFQSRAAQWLLNKEGVAWTGSLTNEEVVLESYSAHADGPLSFRISKDADGDPFYVSDLYHVVLKDIESLRQREHNFRGGILAEEMGLGKTVETISLILLHKRPPVDSVILDEHAAQELRPTSATLIVTPVTLSKQWVSEFGKHAPNLRVMVYNGVKRHKGDEGELIAEMAEHDVVITTYNVLQSEIHFTQVPPDRLMRHERVYYRPRSPLVQLSWWRVCLDEAQQIESGVSNAAKVARLIPRVNAWGITGTPVKEDIKDLWGLLRKTSLSSAHFNLGISPVPFWFI